MPATAAVLATMREEVAPLVARLRVERRHRARRACFLNGRLDGRLDGRPLVVGWTGDGAPAAERGLRALAAWCPVERLLAVGVAGGLSPGLAPGQLIAGAEVRDAAGLAPSPDTAALERALAWPEVLRGRLYSAPRIAAAAAAKAELLRRLGGGEPAAVDLESAAFARTAAALGIPYLAMRAISDPAEETLAVDFDRFCDAEGRVRRGAVALHAVLHPSLISSLRALQGRVRLCAEGLAGFVEGAWL